MLFKEVVLTDVCPYTLGVGVSESDAQGRQTDGIFSPIIARTRHNGLLLLS